MNPRRPPLRRPPRGNPSAPPHRLTDEEVAQLAHDCEQDPFGAADPQPLAVAWRHIRCLVDEVIATRKSLAQ